MLEVSNHLVIHERERIDLLLCGVNALTNNTSNSVIEYIFSFDFVIKQIISLGDSKILNYDLFFIF